MSVIVCVYGFHWFSTCLLFVIFPEKTGRFENSAGNPAFFCILFGMMVLCIGTINMGKIINLGIRYIRIRGLYFGESMVNSDNKSVNFRGF